MTRFTRQSVASALRRRGPVVVLAAIAWAAATGSEVGPYAPAELVAASPSREWTLVDGKYWQVASGQPEAPAVTDEAEGTRGACPEGMVEVRGAMKVDAPAVSVEDLQNTTCTEWIAHDPVERCRRFDADAWRALSSRLSTRAMHFCVDRFEYPDRNGEYPLISVTWHEATALCERRGNRLCTEDEWTFACEGEAAQPYASGYLRDSEACVIDRPWRPFHADALVTRDGPETRAEIDALWQGAASGSHPGCRSPFGVYDMTGNVDEWTRSVQREGHPSILKGGYWGPVRTRCRPSTRVHDPNFHFYQQGLRCCGDAPAP